MSKKYGWVIQEDGDGLIVPNSLEEADVFETREEARKSHLKLKNDVVRKVRVDDTGKAIEVIPGR